MSKLCVVAAGGTGGHMFPAEALARELAGRGWRLVLATDHRGEQYAHAFPAEERLALDAATGAGPLGLIKAGVQIFKGVMQARAAFDRLGADVVVGFGGYPSAPALVAAVTSQRPTVIHEQNAVLGRTNRILAPYVGQVASSFPTLERAPAQVQGRSHVVGSPVRADIRALFDRPYVAPAEGGPIQVLVTGGSQAPVGSPRAGALRGAAAAAQGPATVPTRDAGGGAPDLSGGRDRGRGRPLLPRHG